MKGLRFLLLGMAICLASEVRAQIYNSEVLFFYCAENTAGSKFAGSLNSPQVSILICKFKNGKVYCPRSQSSQNLQTYSAWKVRENLNKNMNYYETQEWAEVSTGFIGYYDSDMSTNKWTVFKVEQPKIDADEWNSGSPAHNEFNGFKNDFSEYQNWCEPDVFGRGRYTYKKCNKTGTAKYYIQW